MELRFTTEQDLWRQKVRRFAESEIAPTIPAMEQLETFPEALVGKMAAMGLLGIPIARSRGGIGLDFISYIVALHEISKVSAAVGVIVSVHTSVGTLPILQYGTEEQAAKYVTRLARGQWLGAFALTEPHAGSDAVSIRTSAIREGDHYVLNGSKCFITNAGVADVYLTFAVNRSEDSTGNRLEKGGITAFLLEKDAPGFRIGLPERKMGLHGSNTCELHLDDVRVPVAQRLGEEGAGFAIAKGSLDGGRIGIAAQALGVAEAALQLAVGWLVPKPSGARKAVVAVNACFGEGGGGRSSRWRASPQMKARLLELTAQVEAARLLVYRAAWLRQEGLACTKEASMAKLFASDTAVAVTSEAIRLIGPESTSKEYALERLFRDAKVTQIYEGTNEIHRIVIGNQLLKG